LRSNGRIRLAALVPYPVDTTPSQRFRIEQWKPLAELEGISVDYFPFATQELFDELHEDTSKLSKAIGIGSRFFSRIGDVLKARSYDIVFVHRALSIVGPAMLERALVSIGPPVIFDFDDAIFIEHTAEANRAWGWLKFPRKTDTICRLSSHVMVGNNFLRDYALRFNPNVTVVPTSVDTERYQFRPDKFSRNGHKPLIVGWTGSSTSQTYLEAFAPVLREVISREGIEFRIHSDRRPQLPDLDFVWREWSPETEVDEISKFDIGIMPMPDTDWARGKCAMKALLYMSVGVPAVCSAVGANMDVIENGRNGLLASTAEDWSRQIHQLLDDANLRKRIAIEGRKTVEDNYSMQRSAGLFLKIVRDTVKEVH